MLALAVADGTEIIVATPHDASATLDAVIDGVERLNQAAARARAPITVLPGSEVRLAPDLVDRFRAGKLITLNGTDYVLLDLLESAGWPPFLRSAIYDLQLAGLQPILAHAERYFAVQRRPSILVDLVDAGVLVQVNADSLLDNSTHARRRTAELLIRLRLAHIIASDAHGSRRRPPRLAAAYERARHLTTDDYVTWMQDATAAVARGQPVTTLEVDRDQLIQSERRHGPIGRWFSRVRIAHE